jgi:PAS domain S-box-containing protein
MHNMNTGNEERVLVLAPTAGDAALSRSLLTDAGLACHVSTDLCGLCRDIAEGAGALLLTEEVLAASDSNCLVEAIRQQPAWSDVPILLLCDSGADSPVAVWSMELLGNVTVLERPIRVTTLVSALRTALKARRRQYELRNQVEAVRSSEERLRLFIEHAPAAIAMFDRDMRYLAASRRWLADYGLPGDIIGKSHYEVFSDIPDRWREAHHRGLAGAIMRADEDPFERADGTLQWLRWEVRPWHTSSGEIGGILIFSEEITERRRAEEQLRQSEARFRQLANAMPQIVWAARPDGYIDYYNERWYEYTGFSRGEYGQPSWEPILHPDDVQRCVDTYFACIKAEQPYQIEYRFKDRKTGGYRWFLGRAVPVRDEQGRIVRWFGTCTDIDDTKCAEEALKEADRRKDEFLAMLAHELRNPLAPIRNALHVVQMRGQERRQAVRQAWEMIERQVENLVRLVDDLLDVSRIGRGKISLQKEPVDVATLVARAVEGSRPLIEARRHDLKVALPDEPMRVEADPTRMAQVLWNLLNNAAKYTPEGGRIWLTAAKEGGEAVIRVRDTGMGIPPELLPKMFDLFTQAERTLDRAEGGLGIGLTLVRRLTEMHNGVVEAFSAGPGEGSEFVVRLPLLPDVSPAATAHEPDGGKRAKAAVTHRILVVDDNRDSADSLAMLLRLVGHDVRTAHDGRQALVVAATYRPDLVLLDIGLPGMDGFTVARHLRSQPELAGVVLVALTGYGSDEDRRQAQAAGFNHHMVKPVNFDALNELLSALEPHDARRL